MEGLGVQLVRLYLLCEKRLGKRIATNASSHIVYGVPPEVVLGHDEVCDLCDVETQDEGGDGVYRLVRVCEELDRVSREVRVVPRELLFVAVDGLTGHI